MSGQHIATLKHGLIKINQNHNGLQHIAKVQSVSSQALSTLAQQHKSPLCHVSDLQR